MAVDSKTEQIISRLTDDRRKRGVIVSLLQRLANDGWICESLQGGYDWKEKTDLHVIAFWINRVEFNLGLAKEKVRWKPFCELFNLKRKSLRQERQDLKYKREWIDWQGVERIKEYTTLQTKADGSTYHQQKQKSNYSVEAFLQDMGILEDSDKAFNIKMQLDRLLFNGFISPLPDGGYQWRKGITKQQIAYWAVQINQMLGFGERSAIWKPFEDLFNLKYGTLKTAKGNWQSLKKRQNKQRGKRKVIEFKPKGYEVLEPYTKIID